ncbi:MAG TPA: MBL fold metallo-hydrolase [Candidatus Nanoarchaeia archaeon]|nr:MBL fold metallo-hydrolase [Candidatus Nanoarchaeia archaeon]
MDRIVFLGTSGDSSVTAKQQRASGGFVLQIGELQFHIDPGPGALVRAKEFGINARATSAVLVTNNHLNHAHDVNAVVDAMTLGGMDKRGVLIGCESVLQGDALRPPALSPFHRGCLERVLALRAGQKAALEDIEIHGLFASHEDTTAIGIKILAPKFTIGYSSDTAYTKDVAAALEGCDIVVLNVTHPEDTKSDYHLNRADAIKILEKVQPKLAIITHFGFGMLKADPLLEARQMQILTGVQVVAAHDGLTLSPQSYAAQSNQARLTTFDEMPKENPAQ